MSQARFDVPAVGGPLASLRFVVWRVRDGTFRVLLGCIDPCDIVGYRLDCEAHQLVYKAEADQRALIPPRPPRVYQILEASE
jgi:hypothetical protein